MAVTYMERDIESLVQERKPLPADWRSLVQLRPKRWHSEQHLDPTGEVGSKFRLIFRQNRINSLDFSVILAVRVPQLNKIFRPRRYNSKSHEHTSHIEGVTFYDFHIHFATERYQGIGTGEDAFAEATDHYGDLYGALRCLFDDANFAVPPDPQGNLFEEE